MGKKKSNAARLKLELNPVPQYNAMVATCKQQVATIKQCSDYPNQPAVQAATSLVLADANALDQVLTDLSNAHALVASLEGKRVELAATLRRDHDGLESALDVASNGDPQAVLAWGGEIVTRTPAAPSIDAPAKVTVKTTETPGKIVAKCKAVRGAICYLFQHGTDPTNPDAWPAPAIEGQASHEIAGLTLGQTLYCRIAVVRRGTGQGQWSGIVSVIVR